MLSVSIGAQRLDLSYARDGIFHVFRCERFGIEARHKNQKKAHAEIVRLLTDLLA